MYTPELSPGHARFEQMAGQWDGEETMHPSQWDPKGGAATGRNDCKVSLKGFAMLTEYEQERDGEITFTGHGIYTYDPNADEYTLHWFDCMGSPPEVFKGRFDGDVLVLGHGGPGMHARMTYDYTTPGVLDARMEMSDDGEDWNILFEATYTRNSK